MEQDAAATAIQQVFTQRREAIETGATPTRNGYHLVDAAARNVKPLGLDRGTSGLWRAVLGLPAVLPLTQRSPDRHVVRRGGAAELEAMERQMNKLPQVGNRRTSLPLSFLQVGNRRTSLP